MYSCVAVGIFFYLLTCFVTSQENQISDLSHCQVMSCLIINIKILWWATFKNSLVFFQVTVQVGFEPVNPSSPSKFPEKC